MLLLHCVQAAPDQTAISKHKEAVVEHSTRLADLEKATAERDEVSTRCARYEFRTWEATCSQVLQGKDCSASPHRDLSCPAR